MRKGIKTTEFWVGLIASVFLVVQRAVWPESPFPVEAFTALGVWVGARFVEKAATDAGTEQRAWKTSEFWLATAFAAVKYLFPDTPDGVFAYVAAYVVGRPALKIFDWKK